MDWALVLLIILILGATWFFFYPFLTIGKKAEEQLEENINIKPSVDPSLRKINAFFFEDNVFSFEKFCDYILCIHDCMSISEAAQALMELDLLVKCSGDLSDRFMSILIYSETIEKIDYENFYDVKKGIKEGQYQGTYQDMMVIYITAVFFLKHILKEKRSVM